MLGLLDAQHAEYDPTASSLAVVPASCPVPYRAPGAPRLSGTLTVRLVPGSIAARAYSRGEITEDFWCNYELNPEFRRAMEHGGLRITGVGEHGEARMIELPGHPFYLASLFRPQLSSAPGRPHPLIVAYLEAVAA